MAPPKGSKYAKGHGFGAPLKYTDKMIEAEAEAFLEWMKLPESVFFKTFAIERGYSPQRLTEFAKQNNIFSEVLNYARQWQECKLMNCGLFRKTDAGITKFALVNHHGYKDKVESDLTEVQQAMIVGFREDLKRLRENHFSASTDGSDVSSSECK